MNLKTISITIIIVVSVLLLLFGTNYLIDLKGEDLKEKININEGIITELKKQIAKDSILSLKLKHSIDSAMNIKTDTVKIYETKYIKINSVKQLNAIESINLLARNISKVDTTGKR